ncbi:MAG: hypothetical protein GWN93_06245 [Deltaproteobacteria bacterium]|nr:hypothetical protein [Deltaproteobacteria bacterium]
MLRLTEVGIIADGPSEAAKGYAEALGTRHVLDINTVRSWRQIYTWFRNVTSYDKYIEVAILLTDKATPYLSALKSRYGTVLVAVPFHQWGIHYDYDFTFMPWEIGWGIDKSPYQRVAESRRPKTKPAFHMLSHDAEVEEELRDLGYDVFFGNSYHMADVALEPSRVLLPTRMYEAAASRMPVISVRANEGWTKAFGAYDYLFLDDIDLDLIVEEVADSDFLYAGMMAMDMVPSFKDFREHIRALLNNLRPD